MTILCKLQDTMLYLACTCRDLVHLTISVHQGQSDGDVFIKDLKQQLLDRQAINEQLQQQLVAQEARVQELQTNTAQQNIARCVSQFANSDQVKCLHARGACCVRRHLHVSRLTANSGCADAEPNSAVMS